MFGAWDIALAAYNAGPGRIKKIPDIYTSKKTPKVTRKYVPSLMAAYTMAQNPEDFGFYPDERTSYEENEYIEIMTEKSESLKAIAIKHNTTVKELKELNPALRTDKTPPYPYTIRVPAI
jgi:membrane-bound lytic murein transglycosylase D